MTALVFPSNPTVGQVFQNWIWDGTMWTAQGPLFMPLNGVTDGSSAAPGQVGEFLTAIAGPITIAASTIVTVCTLALPAGDWLIAGWGTISTATASNNLQIYMSNSISSVLTYSGSSTMTGPTGQTNLGGSILPVRIGSASPFTVGLVLYSTIAGNNCSGQINAWRMR